MGTGTDGGQRQQQQGQRRRHGGRPLQRKQRDHPPPPPPPVAITSGPDPSSQYALCIAISARGHSGSASPRKKDHVPFLVVAAPPLVCLCFRLSFASRSLLWLVVASPFVASPSPCVTRRTAISHPLNALLHRLRHRAANHRCRCVAVAPSIVLAAS